MTDQLKPSNDEIAEYILMWHIKLTWSDNPEEAVKNTDFQPLRDMFTPSLYNSIEDYVKGEK